MNAVVFTKEWIDGMRGRYENKPRHRRPLPYLIATDVECQTLRKEIEQFVVGLPAPSQVKVIPKLQSEQNFWQTYHELVVGDLLKKRGLRIEYDRKIDDLTPDWFASPSDGPESMIVEVFTQNISSQEAQRHAQLVDLQWRFANMQVDAQLEISSKGKNRNFDSLRNKRIAVGVKQWLGGTDSKIGATLCVEGLEFKVINRHRGFPRIHWLGFSECLLVNPVSLRKNLVDKVKKYQSLASRNRLPLVVGVVANIRTGCDLEEFENILLGHLVYDVARDSGSVQGVRRKSDSLFAEKTELSGAIWARKGQGGKWEMKWFVNPRACLPLSSELANALCGEQLEPNS